MAARNQHRRGANLTPPKEQPKRKKIVEVDRRKARPERPTKTTRRRQSRR